MMSEGIYTFALTSVYESAVHSEWSLTVGYLLWGGKTGGSFGFSKCLLREYSHVGNDPKERTFPCAKYRKSDGKTALFQEKHHNITTNITTGKPFVHRCLHPIGDVVMLKMKNSLV